MANSFNYLSSLNFAGVFESNRLAAGAQRQAQMQNQFLQSELQCQSQLQSEYQQVQMMGGLLSPISVRDAAFNSLANAVPHAVLVFDGEDENSFIDNGEQIVDRIMFWRQIPLAGKWIAERLAEQLDSISDTLERISARKMAHG